MPTVIFRVMRGNKAMDGERATQGKLSHQRGWEGQRRAEATAVGACRAARPFSLIDTLLITLIKANIRGNQGSHEGGCHSQKTKDLRQ